MKKKLLLLIIPILLLVISSFVFTNKKEYKIERVLQSKYYSYLPEEAKDLIEKTYKNTGEIILTEKNKKVNTPYLNPRYVEYMQLSDEVKEDVEVIPEVFKVEYDYSNTTINTKSTASSYDLRNDHYLTPLKNQGSLGICWAFAAAEQAESLAMVQAQQQYNSSTKILSPRQIDYATSRNGIIDYTNEYGARDLADGSNFYVSAEILSYGLSLIDESKMPYSTESPQKELASVLNFNNSNYEVNGTINLPPIFSRENIDYTEPYDVCSEILDTDEMETCLHNYENAMRDVYMQKIKEGIKEYGGAVVETMAPGPYACGFKNTDNTSAFDVNAYCYDVEQGHAMQLIGWDDNYNYSFCKTSDGNESVSSNGTCTTGTKVDGTGAFIIRNSWGQSEHAYAYLTYASLNETRDSASVHFITDMSSTANRTWDNVYKGSIDHDDYYSYGTSMNRTFEKKISGNEKLEKIKFTAYTADATYSIRITSGGKQYQYNNILTVNFPGLYTIDLSDKNIILEEDNFNVRVYANNNKGFILNNSISAFTSNTTDTPVIEKDNITSIVLDDPKQIERRILYKTKNINSNETISFHLESDTKADFSNYLTVTNNKVAANNLNVKVSINTLPVGKYNLVASYNNVEDKMPITVNTSMANITYYANDGTDDYHESSVKKSTSIVLINNPYEKTGYKFKEWNTASDGTGTSYAGHETISDGITDDLVLYAIWEPITYIIKFNANGGVGEMNDQTMTYDTPSNLNENKFTKAGYEFLKWNTASDGTGISYNDKQSVNNLTETENNIINLYAIYKSVGIAQIEANPTEVNYGEVYTDWNTNIIRKVKVRNTGNVPVKLSLKNPTAIGPFGSQDFETGKRLEPNEEYEITLIANHNGNNHDQAGTYYGTYKITGTSVYDSNKSHTINIATTINIKRKSMSLAYTTHVQNIGWQNYVTDGEMAGTSGRSLRLEGIKIKINNPEYSGNIEYRTHIQNIGWESSFKKNDEMSGTSGKALRLEAIEIKLTGEMAEHYDIYYRVHAQTFGWLGWAKNGEDSGTAGFGFRLEGIEIKLVQKNTQLAGYGEAEAFKGKVLYTTHVQNIGWQKYTYDGRMAGTSGRSLRLEGIKIKHNIAQYSGNVEYRTHIQNIGWESSFKKNNEMSGTSGRSLRLEAIQIHLTGELSNHFDIYYRVHAQNFGWLAWAKNNEEAGTAGFGFRLEGIEIVIVQKGENPPERANQQNSKSYIEK